MLTPRQFEVYMLAVNTAAEPDEMAQELGISGDCVSHHLSAIYAVMGVNTRLELMAQYWHREMHPEAASASVR